VIVQRVFAVLAAALGVGAVAVAMFGARAMTLEQALGPVGRVAARSWCERILGVWAWERLAQPFMVRPAWLVPVCLAVLCAGIALSLAGRARAGRERRQG
jgi:hypothetical protein